MNILTDDRVGEGPIAEEVLGHQLSDGLRRDGVDESLQFGHSYSVPVAQHLPKQAIYNYCIPSNGHYYLPMSSQMGVDPSSISSMLVKRDRFARLSISSSTLEHRSRQASQILLVHSARSFSA